MGILTVNGKGILILLHKKKINTHYRLIVLLPTSYKIWAAVLSNRVAPITNLLAGEFQRAYEIKKKKRPRRNILR